MSTPADTQLCLPLGGSPAARMVRTTRRANKKRLIDAIRISASLPFKDRYFLPLAGVPKTRADCPPPSEYCRHIKCRQHLAMIDAEHRAGRPGLANVPRNHRGLTMPVVGDLGAQRAGTTFDPRWLELERACKVSLERDDNGKMLGLNAVYENEADLFFERLHVGEPIDVIDGHLQKGEPFAALRNMPRVMGARLAPTGNVVFDSEPTERVTQYVFTLVRVRGVESCALNMIDRLGKCSNQAIGDGLGRHRTLVAREVRNGMEKAKKEARRQGMDLQDLMRAMMTMGEGR